MKIKELKMVETIEDFRNTLLKLFYSNQDTRMLFLLVDNKSVIHSVDKFDTFQDIMNLSETQNVLITPKFYNMYFSKKPIKLNNLDDLGQMDIIEDETNFMNIIGTPLWFSFKDSNLNYLINKMFDITLIYSGITRLI
jgi:hypothetical protein